MIRILEMFERLRNVIRIEKLADGCDLLFTLRIPSAKRGDRIYLMIMTSAYIMYIVG